MAKSNTIKYAMSMVAIVLAGAASYALYGLINLTAEDALTSLAQHPGWGWLGNEYAKMAAVVLIVVLLLVVVWKAKLKNAFERVIK